MKPSSTRNLRVGDRVAFPYGVYELTGEVVEDRGKIGPDGQHLIRVAIQLTPGTEPSFLELPVQAVRTVARAGAARQKH